LTAGYHSSQFSTRKPGTCSKSRRFALSKVASLTRAIDAIFKSLDRLMPLRSLDYAFQIFRYQVREWSKTHRSFSRIRFDPVLSVVFYTGTRRWDSPGRLVDLVDRGGRFESMIMEEIRSNSRNCVKRSNPRSEQTYIARRYTRCEERWPTY
jgi:hypothetical protein